MLLQRFDVKPGIYNQYGSNDTEIRAQFIFDFIETETSVKSNDRRMICMQKESRMHMMVLFTYDFLKI